MGNRGNLVCFAQRSIASCRSRTQPAERFGHQVGWIGHGYLILMEDLESSGSVSPPDSHKTWTFAQPSLAAAVALPGMSEEQAERSIELVGKLHARFLGRIEVISTTRALFHNPCKAGQQHRVPRPCAFDIVDTPRIHRVPIRV